ncbi:non-ribosomal peptide synthetase, partial [Motilimonas pumila]
MTVNSDNLPLAPLTLTQQDIYFDQLHHDTFPLYNVAGYIKLSNIDTDKLTKAHKKLINCSDVFGLRVVSQDDGIRQYISKARETELPIIDFSQQNDAEEKAKQWLKELVNTKIEIENSELFRAYLLKISANHYFCATVVHHIAMDGMGIANWVEKLGHYYQQLDSNIEEISWLDITKRDQKYLASEKYLKDKKFWEKELAELPDPIFSINSSNFHRYDSTTPSKRETIKIGDNIHHGLVNKATQFGVSISQMYLGLTAIYFSKAYSVNDLVVGLPVHNRRTRSEKDKIGAFTSVSPLRLSIDENLSMVDFFEQIRLTTRKNLRYQRYPIGHMQRDMSTSENNKTLYQIGFNYLNMKHGFTVGEQLVDLVYLSHDYEQTPIQLNVWEQGGVEIKLDYNLAYFSEQDIDLFVERFEWLIKQVLECPLNSVNELQIIPEKERHQLLVEWNDTTADFPQENCIHELFEAQAKASPHATALVFEDKQLSYGELNKQANQLAHYLITEKQVTPDTLIGICIERSLEMVVAMLAILKAGGAYVPLDPTYPEARLAYMLADSGLSTVITQSDLLKKTSISEAQAVCLDSEMVQQELRRQLVNNPDKQVLGLNSNHLAYVIYTSGSMGNPKGVMIEHRSTVAFISWALDVFSIDELACVLASTSVCFDLSVFEIFVPLSNSGSVVVVQDILALQQSHMAQSISLINTVPSAAEALLTGGAIPEGLRVMNLAGEPLKQSLVERLYDVGIGLVYDLYGPSEDTTYSTYSLRRVGERSCIGKPIANTQVYLLNKQLEAVPEGIPAELLIGGKGLARGYLNRADLTTQAFIDNPFYDESSSHNSERLYKTGDLVRWLPDGNLEYLGRIDHQVKIRGFRVELGEVESCLTRLDGVEDAVVVSKESTTGDKRLVAYVVADNVGQLITDTVDREKDGRGDTAQQEFITLLRQYVIQSLPDYMVPAAFVLLEQLPLTQNGKIDRKALPEPEFSMHQAEYIAPRTETENILCEIWQEVLGVEQVGVTDNFFQLGGHSLLMMQVFSHLQQTGVNVTAKQLFMNPELAVLASLIEQLGKEGELPFVAPENLISGDCDVITPAMLPLASLTEGEIAQVVEQVPGGITNVQDIYPLGPLQEGILFHHMVSTKGDPYILPVLLKVDCEEAVFDFIKSLQFVINRHDSLRTAILWEGLSEPVQVVCREVTLPVHWVDLNEVEAVLAHMHSLCAPDSQNMGLQQAPLIKIQIASDPETEHHFILLQFHHIISDHVGVETIKKELALFLAGQTQQLDTPVPYREFIAHAQYHAKRHDAESYFRDVLSNVDEPSTPFGLANVQGDGGQVVELRETVPDFVSHQLRQVAKRLMVSSATLFHTAWSIVVAGCSGRDDVVFGTVLSGRLQGTVGAENILGVCINTLPLRVKLNHITVTELVYQVHDSLRKLLSYEQASLALAQRCSSLEVGVPLFSALLNYRHSVNNDYESGIAPGVDFIEGQERTNYPFNLSVDDFGCGFGLEFQIDVSVNAKNVVAYMQTTLTALVDALTRRPEQQINTLSILPELERHKLLVEWNDTAADYPKDKCIHELFETQVKA